MRIADLMKAVKAWLLLPVALVLAPLVMRNYCLRAAGKLPDQWYWADRCLIRVGWVVAGVPPKMTLRRF